LQRRLGRGESDLGGLDEPLGRVEFVVIQFVVILFCSLLSRWIAMAPV
jgi:hypothetical protein